MLKIRNGAVRVLRFILIGIMLVLTAIFRALFEVCDWTWSWLDQRLPKPKLSAAQIAEWDAYEKERRDRLTMTLAEFDAAYPPGDPLHWKEPRQHTAVTIGPWVLGPEADKEDEGMVDMKLHGVDVSVDIDSFQPKEHGDDKNQ